MALIVKKKSYPQQLTSIYHYSLIQIIVLHQLNPINMPWETLISHEMLKGPQVFSSVPHQEGGPSGNEKVQETEIVGVPVFVIYERGTRKLFAAVRRVLSPQGVEGVSPSSSGHRKMISPQGVEGYLPSSSTKQVQVGKQYKGKGKGKKKMHEKDLSDGQERDFDLVDHEETQGVDVIDLEAQYPKSVKDMIIKEQEVEIQALPDNL